MVARPPLRPASGAVLLALLLALGGAGCGDEAAPDRGLAGDASPAPAPDAAAPPPDSALADADLREFFARRPVISLLLCGGQRGKLKPCGCSEPQLGGLARLAFLWDLLRQRAEHGRGLASALSLGWTLKGSGEAQEEAKADYVRAVYEALGFAGLLLGDTDLLVDAYTQPRGAGDGPLGGLEAPRPPVNCRLPAHNPAAETPALLELQLRTLRVRAYSFVEPAQAEALKAAGSLEGVTSPNGAFGGLTPRADALWLVSCWQPPPATLASLTHELERLGPAILVVLGDAGGATRVDRQPLGAGRAPLVIGLSELGKAAGVLDLEEDKDGTGWLASWRRIDLDPGMDVGGTPGVAQVEELDALYRRVVRERGYLVDFPRFRDEGVRFVGSSACAQCHAAIYREWKQTPHAQALPTLRERNYHWDPECIRCHVVGWDRTADDRWYVRDSSFRDPERTPFLGGVGCENCHGPGSAHVADPWNRALFGPEGPNRRAPDPNACQRCHDAENSVHFAARADWYRDQVDHSSVPRDRRTVLPEGAPPGPGAR